MLDASVVLVNFRTERLVIEGLRHLEALGEERPRETIVVDNSPERGLGEQLTRLEIECRYLATERNVGFAAAVNLALDLCRRPFVILLGPDARPQPGCLGGLIEALEGEEGAAIAGPLLVPLSAAEPRVPSALRRDPDLLTALVEYTALRRLVETDWLGQHYFSSPDGTTRPEDCAMVQGACLAARRVVLELVGRLDAERFFVYWEETDLCRRVRAAGGRVIYCRGLVCGHSGGASIEGGDQDSGLFWRGFYAYHRKYGGRMKTLLMRCLLVAGIGVELGILSLLDVARRGRDEQLRRDRAVVADRLARQLIGRPDPAVKS